MENKSDKDRILESIEIDAFDLLDSKMGNKALEQLHRRMWIKSSGGK